MADLSEISALVKALVISNQKQTTIEQLQKDYREATGKALPWLAMGYSSIQDFLVRGLNNAVTVHGYGLQAIVKAKVDNKTQHIYDLVSEQKYSRKRPSRRASDKKPAHVLYGGYNQQYSYPNKFNNLAKTYVQQIKAQALSTYVAANYNNGNYFSYNHEQNFNQQASTTLLTLNGQNLQLNKNLTGRVSANIGISTQPLHSFQRSEDFAPKVPYTPRHAQQSRTSNSVHMPYRNFNNSSDTRKASSAGVSTQPLHSFQRTTDFVPNGPNTPQQPRISNLANTPSRNLTNSSHTSSPGSAGVSTQPLHSFQRTEDSVPKIPNTSQHTQQPRISNSAHIPSRCLSNGSETSKASSPPAKKFHDNWSTTENSSNCDSPKSAAKGPTQSAQSNTTAGDLNAKTASEERKQLLKKLLEYKNEILAASTKTTTSNSIEHKVIEPLDTPPVVDQANKVLDDLKEQPIEPLQKAEIHEKSGASDSSLLSVDFPTKPRLRLDRYDDEAVPDFAVNTRDFCFGFDYPVDTVPFGQKIEPFQMPADIGVDSIISIYITEIHNPYRFWFHYDYEALDELMHKIELFYAQDAVEQHYKMRPEHIRRGQICAALYDDAWHRAEILSANIAGKVKVFYLDYGTVDYVPPEDLIYLRKEFSHEPKYACRGALAEISPIRLHWSTQATIDFLNLVKNTKLHAKVCEIDKQERGYYLQVLDNHANKIVHINRELIKLKHATKCSEWQRCKLTGQPRLRHKREEYPTFEMLENGNYPTFIEIHAMEAKGIMYENSTDKLIYNPNIIKYVDDGTASFFLLESNPFKAEILEAANNEQRKNNLK